MMQHGGSNLLGISVLDETYIVVDKGDDKIYECPLTSVGIYEINCEVFANKPQGTSWDPINVLVDPIKRLVFVVDYDFSDVLVLDFDGAFLTPLASSLGALMQPWAMAQRPGLYAPLSPSHPPSSLPTAGEHIEVALVMMDAYNSTVSNSHPTSAHDLALEVSATGFITGTNFTTTIAGEILYKKYSPAHASLTAFIVIPYAGDWSVSVTQGTYNVQHFLGSPRLITVAPDATDPASCVVETPSGRSITAGSFFEAIVETFDKFENPTSHPEDSFKSRDITIPTDLAATVTFEFTLDGVLIGDGEVATVVVTPPTRPDLTPVFIGAGVGSFLLIAVIGYFLYFRRASQQKVKKMLSKHLQTQARRDNEKNELVMVRKNLEAEKEELEEEMRLKKHSEEELKVMVQALEEVSKERQDELKEVMMDSKELKIDKLLGKGGFGVVNLATYRGTKVAMKQLLTVTEENVLRFRHECFLMKNLAHPNVVKLVGVCWSEDLFACCLEFVENGSLEDWLRRTPGGKKYDFFTSTGYSVGDERRPVLERWGDAP
ncbi:hypothetical protein TeGR_g6231 [Tetraparma gracilis]|uniref:Protein kinase domain-containing protein n=1 Tax=Tetraparma gracilis TaxID=2962635 RepID=A0ABQ6M494_9STRA|nr:hypothetical protein TeGR_g6231 [Tetraparma gracilis]